MSALEPSHRLNDRFLDVFDHHLDDAIVGERVLYLLFDTSRINEKHDAHHVFERLLLRRRILFQRRMLKTWMFKFKPSTIMPLRSEKEPYPRLQGRVTLLNKVSYLALHVD
ncbi:unnamed protein product [Cochlearia groenlandica]